MPSRYSQMLSLFWSSLSMISLNVINSGRFAPSVSHPGARGRTQNAWSGSPASLGLPDHAI